MHHLMQLGQHLLASAAHALVCSIILPRHDRLLRYLYIMHHCCKCLFFLILVRWMWRMCCAVIDMLHWRACIKTPSGALIDRSNFLAESPTFRMVVYALVTHTIAMYTQDVHMCKPCL